MCVYVTRNCWRIYGNLATDTYLIKKRLFPIRRKENWQDVEFVRFDKTTFRFYLCSNLITSTSLIRTLAIFYLLITIIGIIFIVLGFIHVFTNITERRAVALMDVVVALVTLFNLSTHQKILDLTCSPMRLFLCDEWRS